MSLFQPAFAEIVLLYTYTQNITSKTCYSDAVLDLVKLETVATKRFLGEHTLLSYPEVSVVCVCRIRFRQQSTQPLLHSQRA